MELTRIVPASPSRHAAVWAIREPDGDALVTLALTMRSRVGAGLWREIHDGLSQSDSVTTHRDHPPPHPWLAVALHAPLIVHPHSQQIMGWLGDAERCVAWAWIEGVYR